MYVVYANSDVETLQCNLNIPDINRLIKVFSCIDNDNIDIELDNNRLRYTSDNINFKYHLLEDGIITTPSQGTTSLGMLGMLGEMNYR